MKRQIGALAVTMLLAGLVTSGWAQRGIIDRTGTGAYEDISKRNTRSNEREERKKKEAEEARKKADEEKRREDRRKRYETENERRDQARGMTTTGSKETTGTKTAAAPRDRPNANRGAAATQPATAGGSTDPTTQEVNEVILNAVKTRTVEFDVDNAKKSKGIILLNEPKYDAKDRIRAGDTGMAQPL